MQPPSAETEDRGGDRGYTLTEMLVATVLMGSIILAIVGGMWAVVRASRQNDERAKTQAVLGGAADYLVAFLPVYCPESYSIDPYLGQVQQAATTVDWDEDTVQIIDYQYWNPDLNAGQGGWQDSNNLSSDQCSEKVGFTPERTMQLVTLEVTSPSGQYVSTLDVVKSDIRPESVKDVSLP